MDSRRQYLLFFALVVLVATVGFVLARRPARLGPTALSLVPDDAWLVLTVDVEALRDSGLTAPLRAAGSAGPPSGLGALAAQCGFDPLAHLRELVVASPEGGDKGDFGVVFESDVSQTDLSACATRVIAARGGKPETRSREGFEIVEDANDAGHARMAYRPGGPFLVGRGEWLDRMMDRARHAPSASGRSAPAAEHEELRQALTTQAGRPALVVTMVLPKDLRERLKSELGAESAARAEGAPAQEDGGSEDDRAYASVLSVEAAGLAVTTGPAGSTTSVDAELRCETPGACDGVKAILERRREAFARDVGVRLVGLGPLLDSLRLDPRGMTLSLTSKAPTDDLAQALDRVTRYLARP